jgi:hypothetical protein
VGGAVAVLPSIASSAGGALCLSESGKCVQIDSVSTQLLEPGAPVTAITYAMRAQSSSPSGLGSVLISTAGTSGFQFIYSTSDSPSATCTTTTTAAECIGLGASPGSEVHVTIYVNTSCNASGDTFQIQLSGNPNLKSDPNGKADAMWLDSTSVDPSQSYLQEVVDPTTSCGAFEGYQTVVPCPAGTTCTTSTSDPSTALTGSYDNTTSSLEFLGLGLLSSPDAFYSCAPDAQFPNGYATSATASTQQMNVFHPDGSIDGTAVVDVQFAIGAAYVNPSDLSSPQVCFQSGTAFNSPDLTSSGGGCISAVCPGAVYTGLLNTCDTTADVSPCLKFDQPNYVVTGTDGQRSLVNVTGEYLASGDNAGRDA